MDALDFLSKKISLIWGYDNKLSLTIHLYTKQTIYLPYHYNQKQRRQTYEK